MEAVIRKWGNSPAVRLPVAMLKQAGLQSDQRVELLVADGCILIQPSPKVEYSLDALVNGITRANSHAEADFGRPVGKEVW
jgi:antitoxin MazE